MFKSGDRVVVDTISSRRDGHEGTVSSVGGSRAYVNFDDGGKELFSQRDLSKIYSVPAAPQNPFYAFTVGTRVRFLPDPRLEGIIVGVQGADYRVKWDNSVSAVVMGILIEAQPGDLIYGGSMIGKMSGPSSGQAQTLPRDHPAFAPPQHECVPVDVGFNSGKKACKHCDKDM